MKKLLLMTMVIVSTILASCSKEEDDDIMYLGTGSIYGLVTIVDSTEPIKGVGISLYGTSGKETSKIMTTTIFDDGSYEFKDIKFRYYYENIPTSTFYIGIESNNYDLIGQDYYGRIKVEVENGRSKRNDIQVCRRY